MLVRRLHRYPSNQGLSLIEVLASMGMIGILTFVVTATISPLLEKVDSAKLAEQVAALNEAVLVYQANGGTLPVDHTGVHVLAKLRTQANAVSAEQIAGYRGSFLDPRLEIVWQNSREAATSEARVIWQPAQRQFVIQNGGEAGIKTFRYKDGDPPPAGTEHRDAGMKLASTGGWIWDFHDGSPTSSAAGGPSTIPLPPPTSGPPTSFAPQLYAPGINPGSGTFPLLDFPISVLITNPNPAGSSRLSYSINGGPWQEYTDPIDVVPGTTLKALAVTEDPTAWRSSPRNSAVYQATPYQLEPPYISPSASAFHHVDAREIEITIYHHNPEGAAELEYRVGSEEHWHPYSAPFSLKALDHPDGALITARVKAKAEHYLDSEETTAELAPAESLPLKPPVISLSQPAFEKKITEITVTITNPNPPGSSSVVYHLGPLPGEPGSHLEPGTYTIPFTVLQASWPHGFGVWAVAKRLSPIYADSEESVAYASGVLGVFGGHLDLDTSTKLAPIGSGTTNAHTHDFTGKYDLKKVDFFAIPESGQVEIHEAIPPGTRFKILAINGDLSPGLRIHIRYAHGDTKHEIIRSVAAYDDIPIENLPILSLDGALGSYRLEQLQIHFGEAVIPNASVIPSNTGDVKSNRPGRNGEWRNGAFTLQAAAVNKDGGDAFVLDLSRSAGAHGVTTSGFLWEATLFWHWKGPSYHEPGNRYVPGKVSTIAPYLEKLH